MKTKILGLLAVGLLAVPMAANAVSLSMQAGAGVDLANLLVGQQFQVNITIEGGADNEFTAGGGGGNLLGEFPYLEVVSAVLGPDVATTAWNNSPTLFVLTFNAIQSGTGFLSSIGTCLVSNLQDYGCNFSSGPLGFTVRDRTAVPEPGTLALLGLGLAGLGLSRRRKAN